MEPETNMKFFSAIVFFFLLTNVLAQKQNFRSKSELGVLLGGSYYIGDLNQYNHFKNTKPALGVVYRYNVNPRLAFRANVLYGNVTAFDSQSGNATLQNRNLSFSSEIYEFSVGTEFSYFPFQIGHPRYKASAYLLAEIGVFQMNPTTKVNNDVIELQSLGTEGQGTSLSSEGPYSKTQLCIPLGVGFKVSLGKRVSMSLEYGIRKTFTDYLDDVHSSRYVNPDDLADINGPLAASLSNRSLDGSRFGKRGNPTTKDWYVFFGGMITFRLGGGARCNMP